MQITNIHWLIKCMLSSQSRIFFFFCCWFMLPGVYSLWNRKRNCDMNLEVSLQVETVLPEFENQWKNLTFKSQHVRSIGTRLPRNFLNNNGWFLFKLAPQDLITINHCRSHLINTLGMKILCSFFFKASVFQNYKITLVKHKHVMHFYCSQSYRWNSWCVYRIRKQCPADGS